jgi:hypothetical protein
MEVQRPDGTVGLAILTLLDFKLLGDSRRVQMQVSERPRPIMQ